MADRIESIIFTWFKLCGFAVNLIGAVVIMSAIVTKYLW